MTLTVAERAKVLVEALPYIKRFHGQVVVVKVGGNAIERARDETLLDVVLLRYVGMLPVLVHGGGPEITAMSERLGLTPAFKNGLRVTDEKTMEVVKMVLTGKVSPDLVASLNRLGGQAVGMSGEDGPCIIAEPLGPDMGFVGRVVQVNSEPITALLSRGYVPVIASIGLGYDGHAYNINADTVAAEIALALGAAKLILLTDPTAPLHERIARARPTHKPPTHHLGEFDGCVAQNTAPNRAWEPWLLRRSRGDHGPDPCLGEEFQEQRMRSAPVDDVSQGNPLERPQASLELGNHASGHLARVDPAAGVVPRQHGDHTAVVPEHARHVCEQDELGGS